MIAMKAPASSPNVVITAAHRDLSSLQVTTTPVIVLVSGDLGTKAKTHLTQKFQHDRGFLGSQVVGQTCCDRPEETVRRPQKWWVLPGGRGRPGGQPQVHIGKSWSTWADGSTWVDFDWLVASCCFSSAAPVPAYVRTGRG